MLAYLSVPFLGQRLRKTDILAGLVCYAGVVVIATRGAVTSLSFSDPLGVSLAIGSTVIWASYWILATRDTRDPVVGLFLNFLFGLPVIAVICGLTEALTCPAPGPLLPPCMSGSSKWGSRSCSGRTP
ncbi:hypothetical protein [Marinobacter similis]|uniref:hypothetical protein n=1 Tax=Marinobacter similis TaxID=1420916 RepID=UPI001F2D2952|nr:hypothetical protein [Marinobacter similis]